MIITLTSRRSPLAIAQVDEVLKELTLHHPGVQFSCNFIETTGDKDQKTSLRMLDKTDFFTKEIDEGLLFGACRIAVHSAKDLPEPLPEGLAIVALTKGVDSSDALVLKPGVRLESLRSAGACVIATSSVRREEAVREILPDASFRDIRGTINQRLMVLEQDGVDGVVIAEAALIRLSLTNLNRVILPGETVAFQGQLAVVARAEDEEMESLFSCMDVRCTV
jgi:hydroxymethylbilane synthase